MNKHKKVGDDDDHSDSNYSIYVDISKVVIRHSQEHASPPPDTCTKASGPKKPEIKPSEKHEKRREHETHENHEEPRDRFKSAEEERLKNFALRKKALSFGSAQTFSWEKIHHDEEQKTYPVLRISFADAHCFRFFSPKKAYYYAADAIKKYRFALQDDWSQIFNLMTWYELPGNEHLKAKDCNYLSYQMWLYAYTTAHCRDVDDNKEEYLKEYFEDAILRTEESGAILRDFINPVERITERYKFVEKMSHLVDNRLEHSGNDIPTTTLKDAARDLLQENLLTSNCIEDMTKLKIYTRDQSRMQWIEYRKLRFREQMLQLQRGLHQFTQKIKRINSLLPKPLARLKQAESSGKGTLQLTQHIKKMEKNLEKIIRKEHLTKEDEINIRNAFLETNQHVVYIIEKARSLVENVWEIMLMTRLSYIFVQIGPGSLGSLLPYNDILKAQLEPKIYNKVLNASVTYTDPDLFFETACPDILRKAPIIIQPKAEMALHYDGHTNHRKTSSKSSTTTNYVRKETPSDISKLKVLRVLRIDPISKGARPVQSAGSKATSKLSKNNSL